MIDSFERFVVMMLRAGESPVVIAVTTVSKDVV